MKKPCNNPFNFIALLLLLAVPMFSTAAGDPVAEKKRIITKTYSVGADDKLSIENSFGDVTVSTWEKSEIQVNVEISVSSGTDEKAQSMLDEIKVSDRQSGKDISFKTDIGNMGNGKKNKSGDQKFHIDYKVSMPSRNPLKIENSFGKIVMGDYGGPVNLISKFGELNAGKLAMAKEVHVEFGSVNLGAINDADVVFKFNNKSFIANLNGTSKLHIEFCGSVEFSVDESIKSLSLMESYSTVRMNVPDKLSASFDVHTNFGSFRNHSGINIPEEGTDDNSGPKFDKDFSGTAGSGDAKIRIRSSFGSVRLARSGDKSSDEKSDKEEDKAEKKKEKDKHKDKHKTEDDDEDGNEDNDNDSGTDM